MAAPIRFLSGRQQQQKIGIEGSTENQKVFEVIGRAGIGTVIFEPQSELDVRGEIRAENITVAEDLTIGGNLEVQGDLVTINVEEVLVEDKNIILGLTTTSTPTDFTASGGGISIASTEGNPLIVGLSTYDNYKQFSWYHTGSFTGLATDSWISNYAISVGTTSLESGIGLGVGTAVRIYNSGIISATAYYGNDGNLEDAIKQKLGGITSKFKPHDGSLQILGLPLNIAQHEIFDNSTVGFITAVGFGSTAQYYFNDVTLLKQDADGNIFAGDATTGGGYDPSTGTSCFNIFMGCNAGANIAGGSNNNFFGCRAGYLNTTGGNNNFFGNGAGFSNTTGNYNNFFGANAGYANTTGTSNNFIGINAGCSNTTGGCNNFFGQNAGRNNTTGGCNNFLGINAGYNNTTGGNNNFFGQNAGFCNTTGGFNNFLGLCAGYFNTTGACNNFLGNSAGKSNTTGGCNNFFGQNAGRNNTTGGFNNFLGPNAGFSNTTGSHNNFIGYQAGYCNATGGYNNFFGFNAGCNNTTGCNNIAIGCGVQLPDPTGSNQLAIGVGATSWFNGDSNFNIGIGFTNPSAKLEINAGTSIGTTALSIQGSEGQLFSVTNNLTSGSIFSINDASGIPSIDVDADGTILLASFGLTEYVGIGKTDPTVKLDVDGNTILNGDVSVNAGTSIGTTALSIQGSEGQLFSVTNNLTSGSIFSINDASGIPSIDVDADGTILLASFGLTEYVGIGKTDPTVKLDVDGNTILNGDVSVGAGATVAFFDIGSGSVGLGTTNATEKLTVYGNVFVSGEIAGISSFAKELRQDADGNIFAGDATTGGGYDPSTGTSCFNIFMGCNAGANIAGGGCNNFLGRNAGFSNTTGGNNNFLGNSAGRLNTTGNSNNFLGSNAGCSNTTGNYNNFFGNSAGKSNTTGANNTANGSNALFSNTTGYNNVANGSYALYSNTTGNENTATGTFALYSNTTGNYNVANGYRALYSNTTGTQNVATGMYALLSNTTANFNTANGYEALRANTTGATNVANGFRSLYSNTTGSYNVSNGFHALFSNTTGNNNTANGYAALYTNTTGGANVANGYQSLYSNTTASNNVANGLQALYNNTTGANNTANGSNALFSNTTGYNNVANGSYALYSNTTGNENTATGTFALYSNTTGNYNVANGYRALYSNTTGTQNVATGMYALLSNTTANFNTANGYEALRANTTGATNVANGFRSLYSNTTGNNNTANGREALYTNTTGGANVATGRDALYNNTTGSGNIGIGFLNNAGTYAPVFDPTTENNRLVLGHTSITNAYVQVAWTVTSDARDKMNFAPVPYGLDFVNQLKPTAFQFKVDRDTETPSGDVRYGFKAQDILALEGDNPVIIDTEDADHLKYKGEHLVPVLVNAIKELDVENQELKERLSSLEEKVNSLLNN